LPYSSKAFIQSYHVLLARQLFNIPYILRIHGGGMYPSKPFVLHQMLFDRAAAVIAVSTPVKEEFESRHGRRIDMIPSMLPFLQSTLDRKNARVKWGLNIADLVVLFVGSIKPIKGPDLLLKAFLQLGRTYVDSHGLKLVYAGEGVMRPELERQASDSPIGDRVRFLGQVPHEQMCELYDLADIFCIPSLMEARPLSLAEALYNGLPSIGSDIATIRNIIADEETGLLFESRNLESLVSRLKRLVEDATLRQKLGNSARSSYHDFFNYEKMIDDYRKVYDRVIASSRNASGHQLRLH
jgi:glycosyltransferase involved in cell wall biosynthesis